MVPPQDMLMNEIIDYENNNYPPNYSQLTYVAQYANKTEVPPTNSAPYTGVNAHNSAS